VAVFAVDYLKWRLCLASNS